MLAFITKLLKWLPVGGAGIIGVIQAILKFIKEVLTLIVDILFPVIPSTAFKVAVEKLRAIINIIDEFLEKNIKSIFLKIIN